MEQLWSETRDLGSESEGTGGDLCGRTDVAEQIGKHVPRNPCPGNGRHG